MTRDPTLRRIERALADGAREARQRAQRERNVPRGDLKHTVRIPRWRWPAAHGVLVDERIPHTATVDPDHHAIVVETTAGGIAVLAPYTEGAP